MFRLLNRTSSLEDDIHDETFSSNSHSKKSKEDKSGTKLTKIDTLRCASEYILLLTNMLKENNASGSFDSHSSSSNQSSPNYYCPRGAKPQHSQFYEASSSDESSFKSNNKLNMPTSFNNNYNDYNMYNPQQFYPFNNQSAGVANTYEYSNFYNN